MIFPLILIALGIGALAVYASPSGRKWFDEHLFAVKGAATANKTAEEQLEAAAQAAPPTGPAADPALQQVAQRHTTAAKTATQAAAQKTAQIALTAQTPQQRAVATWMAALTLAMQDQIKAFTALQIARGTGGSLSATRRASTAALEMVLAGHRARVATAKDELTKLGVSV